MATKYCKLFHSANFLLHGTFFMTTFGLHKSPYSYFVAEILRSAYPRRVVKTNNRRNREIPEILEHMIFSI